MSVLFVRYFTEDDLTLFGIIPPPSVINISFPSFAMRDCGLVDGDEVERAEAKMIDILIKYKI